MEERSAADRVALQFPLPLLELAAEVGFSELSLTRGDTHNNATEAGTFSSTSDPAEVFNM